MTRQQRLPGAGLGEDGPVTCLGQTFESEDARRNYYLERLAEHLKDPEFRNQAGFPKGTDEAILRMSDPPYYTACPNPFLRELVKEYRRSHPEPSTERIDLFSADTTEGKRHGLYTAHGYHTKVPHLAIAPYILHYTDPGSVVLDGFSGSGMFGVATNFTTGQGPLKDRNKVADHLRLNGARQVQWGSRFAVMSDLSPAATFITSGFNLPYDHTAFVDDARALLDDVKTETGWMYETRHTDGSVGTIQYTVWSQVFSCPQCSEEIVFLDAALDPVTKKTYSKIVCPSCGLATKKGRRQNQQKQSGESVDLVRLLETIEDPARGIPWRRIKMVPWRIMYKIPSRSKGTRRKKSDTYEKVPDKHDLALIDKIQKLPWPSEIPLVEFPIEKMYHGSRLGPKGFTHVHHLFHHRAAHGLAAAWRRARGSSNGATQRMLLWFVEQAIWGMSMLARYAPTHFSQVNQYLPLVYYVGSQTVEVSPHYILEGKLKRLNVLADNPRQKGLSAISTGDCASLPLDSNCIDYVFTDPPFGSNIYYADLNWIVEAFHGVTTDAQSEAIVDGKKQKGTAEYGDLMTACFSEYYRVLKPGRWMTVVFSNSHASVWNAVHKSILAAGFTISDTALLDKEQGSFKQVVSTAVDQDILLTCYKPAVAHTEVVKSGDPDYMWKLVTEHLEVQPIWLGSTAAFNLNMERTADRVFDRMVSMHLNLGVSLPMNKAEFLEGIIGRYVERQNMFFLPHQLADFDRKFMSSERAEDVLPVLMSRKSAISWLRQRLKSKPATEQKLQPEYFAAAAFGQDQGAEIPEMRDLLVDYFVQGENGRWKVPDPKKEAEMERTRKQRNLRRGQQWASEGGKGALPSPDAVIALMEWIERENRVDVYRAIRSKIPANYLTDDLLSMLLFLLNQRSDD